MKSSLVPAAAVAAAACIAGPAAGFAPQVRSRPATELKFGKICLGKSRIDCNPKWTLTANK
jgi:hypothetical protein